MTSLQASSDLLVAIVRSSDDAILTLDLDRCVAFWNRGAVDLSGYAPADVIGKPIDLLMPPGRSEEIRGLLAQIFEGKHVGHVETHMRTKTGVWIPVSVRVSPLRDEAGSVVGASVIVRDLIARTQEDQLLRLRSAELERSNEELEQFAQVLSHDLQEPLRTMKGFADLLENETGNKLDAQTGALLDRIIRGE